MLLILNEKGKAIEAKFDKFGFSIICNRKLRKYKAKDLALKKTK